MPLESKKFGKGSVEMESDKIGVEENQMDNPISVPEMKGPVVYPRVSKADHTVFNKQRLKLQKTMNKRNIALAKRDQYMIQIAEKHGYCGLTPFSINDKGELRYAKSQEKLDAGEELDDPNEPFIVVESGEHDNLNRMNIEMLKTNNDVSIISNEIELIKADLAEKYLYEGSVPFDIDVDGHFVPRK